MPPCNDNFLITFNMCAYARVNKVIQFFWDDIIKSISSVQNGRVYFYTTGPGTKSALAVSLPTHLGEKKYIRDLCRRLKVIRPKWRCSWD